jgi:hypothetical protein
VERIVAEERRRERVPRSREAPRRTLPSGEELFARYVLVLDERLARGERVGAGEIARVLKIEALLENRECVREANELVRERSGDDD